MSSHREPSSAPHIDPAFQSLRRPGPSAGVQTDEGKVALQHEGCRLATYTSQPDLAIGLAPRPYLHPVRTLAGTVVTDFMPASHRHHLGVSVAIPDVGGYNFWGGRTFVPGHGPAWLGTHGVQRHESWIQRTPAEVSHIVRWVTADGTLLLRERRVITCEPVSDTSWALGINFHLRNATEEPLELRTPAVHGRTGAGYGGFFWRAPASSQQGRVFSAAGEGVQAIHGADTDWVAMTATTPEQRDWTLIFVSASHQPNDDRWFVRARDHLAVGSSLAWMRPLTLPPDGVIARRIVTIVADGVVARPAAATLARMILSTA